MNDIFQKAKAKTQNVGICLLCGQKFLIRDLHSLPNNICNSTECRAKLFSAPKTINMKKTTLNYDDKRQIEKNTEKVYSRGPYYDVKNER